MSPAVKCLILVAVVAVLFITELIPLSVTAMGASVASGVLGFLTPKQVFSGLSDSTVVLFAGMFVVGGAMFQTGLASEIGTRIVNACGKGENSLMFGLMLVGTLMSSVLANSGTCACMLPVALAICAAANIPASRELMPLAFACGWGGMITMVGTPPNTIATAALRNAGFETFGFFEWAYVGIPMSIIGMIYMIFIGKHLLPKAKIDPNQEIKQEADLATIKHSPTKMAISGIILLGVIVVMASGVKVLTLEMAAVTGALIACVTGCITEKQAYASIDWLTIFLFAGMLPVSTALDKTGAGKLVADLAVNAMGGHPSPIVCAAVLFILSCGLTQFMSNTASAALLCPIGIAISKELGADPKAVLGAIAIAASCAFATPVGTPPNTLVFGPGRYRFIDYIKPGVPLIIICWIASLILLPIIWPFFPG